jgi:hypothetical protein
VVAHRVAGELELCSDLGITLATADEGEHLALAGRQIGYTGRCLCRCLPRPGRVAQGGQLLDHAAAEPGRVRHHRLNGLDELLL